MKLKFLIFGIFVFAFFAQPAHAVVSIRNYKVTCSKLVVSGRADTAFVGVDISGADGAIVSSYQAVEGVPQFYAPVVDGKYKFRLPFTKQPKHSTLGVTIYEAPEAQPFSRTDFLATINVEDCSKRTPEVRKLRLAALCSPEPDTERVWRVRNPNPYNVTFTWKLGRSETTELGFVSAEGETIFSTPTVERRNVLRVFVGGRRQAVELSKPKQCSED